MTKQEMSDTLSRGIASTAAKKKRFLRLHWSLLLSTLGIGGWTTVLQNTEDPSKLLTGTLAAIATVLAGVANQTSLKKKYQSYRTARTKMGNLLLDVQRHEEVPGELIDKLQAINLELVAGAYDSGGG